MDNKINYQTNISVGNGLSPVITQIEKGAVKTHKILDRLGDSIKDVFSESPKFPNMEVGKLVDLLDRATQSFHTLGSSGAGFEQSMANLSAVTGIAGKDLDELGSVARRIGQETGVGASAAAEAFTQLASQVEISKVGLEGLKTLQKETITLAQATGTGMTEAATAMSTAMDGFGLDVSAANRVINVLAAGSKYGAAGIADLSQSLRITGSTAAGSGLSLEQTAGALEVLSESNLKGAEAGTALQNILSGLQQNLNGDLGEIGLANALDALQPRLSDTAYLSKMFGEEHVSAARYLIANAGAVDRMTEAMTGTSLAEEQAAIRTNTVAERMKQMQASIEEAKLSVFDVTGSLAPYAVAIGELVPIGTDFLAITGACSQSIDFLRERNVLSTAATLAKAAAEKASAGVTVMMTGAQAALNAVMSANPIALIVLAIAGLAAGLTTAYNCSEQFRQVVDRVWAGIKNLASVVWDYVVKAFEGFAGVLRTVWDKLKQLLNLSDDTAEAEEQTVAAIQQAAKAQEGAVASFKHFNETLGAQTVALNTNLETLGGVENKLMSLKAAQKEASVEQAAALEREIRLWEEKLEAMRNAIIIGAAEKPELKPLDSQFGKGNKGWLKPPKLTIGEDGKVKIGFKFDEEGMEEAHTRVGEGMAQIAEKAAITGEQISGALSNAFVGLAESLGTALGSGDFGEQMKSFLIGIMDMLQQFGAALVAAGIAALAFQSIFVNPVAGIIAGAALVVATAAAKAALQNATSFASGGIVAGPTLALVGEYAGASNNPEVIAPLDKLRSLIDPMPGALAGLRLETKVRGKDLFVALRSVEYERRRTR